MNDHTATEEPEIAADQSQGGSTSGAGSHPQADLPTPLSEPPAAAAAQPEAFDRAGFWLRSVAFVIDLSVLSMFSLLLLLVSFLVSAMGADVSGPEVDTANSFSLLPLCELTEFFPTAAYFRIRRTGSGATLGAWLLAV